MSDLGLPDSSSWENVLSSRHPDTWASYKLKGKRKRKLILDAHGSGGLADALKALDEKSITFFGFKVTGIDERGGARSTRAKFVKVCYIGSGVSTMQKAAVGVISGAAFAFLASCHLAFQTSDVSELSEAAIEAKLRAAGGAHQVQRYDFANEGQVKVKKKSKKLGTVAYVAPDATYQDRGAKKELTKEEQAAKDLAERRARENAGAADKIGDSNISGMGSAAHEEMKMRAANAEINWVGAGTEPGLQIWRVENKKGNFGVNKWPTEQYGTFYDGDSFIVLQTYKAPVTEGEEGETSDALLYDLYFWIGKDSTQDERGVVALKTIELDDFLGGKPVQCRCVQGHEPQRFKDLFLDCAGGMMQILSGGIAGGFNIVKPEEYEPRLLRVKGTGNNLSIMQVEFSASAMNKGDVFILDGGLQLWQWNGPESNPNEKRRANAVIQEIYANRQRGDGIVKTPIVMDDNDDDEFWALLKGSPEDVLEASDVEADHDVEASEPELYRVSDASGKMAYELVATGLLKKNMLGSGDVYILDTDTEVYVWVGTGANKEERRCAMFFAQDCLASDDGPHENSPISRLFERDPVLPHGFRACFSDLTN